MHIAFFTNAYHPVVSGVVRSVSAFRQALTELGHNVFIFAHEGDVDDEEPFVFRYPSLPLPLPVDIPATIPVSPFIDRLLPSLKLDVIHSHHPVLLGQTAADKAQELGLPLVFTFHSQYREYTHYIPLPQEVVQRFLKEAVDYWLCEYMRKCQHIVIPSESMRDKLVQDYGLQNRYTVIPTGLDLHPYEIANGSRIRAQQGWGTDKVMVSVGRLSLEKNWPTLLHAAALVRQEHPTLRVVLIGDGPDRKKLLALAEDLGIADRLTFTGKLPFSQVPAYLKAADFFGFASIAETQGLVTMEAMAAGLPIVAVDASGTRDILKTEKQGLLVENNAHALASAIDRLLVEPGLADRFKGAALKTARSFEIHQQARKLLEVYQQASEDKRGNHFVEVREENLLPADIRMDVISSRTRTELLGLRDLTDL